VLRASCAEQKKIRRTKHAGRPPSPAQQPSATAGILVAVQNNLLQALRDRRKLIRKRWDALLRIERISTPLAHPDMLVRLIDGTLDEVFAVLRGRPGRDLRTRAVFLAALHDQCRCGRNPFLSYFVAGEQALLETLILIQAAEPRMYLRPRETAVAELHLVVRRIARREVDSFCALCPQSATAPAAFSFSRREACPGTPTATLPRCVGTPG
jgi:hypothetical protein